MNYSDLKKLKERLYFTVEDAQDVFGIKPGSARVLCTRYTQKGIFVRLKKNLYVLDEKWGNYTREDFYRISNVLQVPSYISFMSALSFYEVTTQVQRDFFENASLKRSVRFDIKGTAFNFYKLKKEYYFDFIRDNDIFIATKEKAFVDSIYLFSFGKYKIDLSSLDLDKLDKKRIAKIIKAYPLKTKKIVSRLCKI